MKKNTLNLLQPIATKSNLLNTTYHTITKNPNQLFAYFGDREVTLQSMKDDPHVAANIQARLAGVQSLEYTIIYDDTNQPYKKIFDYVFNKINIQKLIDDIMDAVFYGFQVLEINWQYEYVDGNLLLLPSSLTAKPREWFVFDNHNILKLNDITKKTLPGYKFLLIQNKPTYTNPYGEALLSKCLWPVVFKKSGFSFWVLMAEKLGIPHLVGKTDATFGTEEFEAFMIALENLMQDGSMVIPITDNIEALNPVTVANTDMYEKLINLCNLEISKAILSQTLTTDIGDTGSFAAANTHKSIKDEVTYSDKLLIEEAIYKLFKWITYFNFDGVNAPYIEFFQKEDVDKPLAEFVDILTKNNQIKFTKQFYINRFNFNDDEFELIETPMQTPPLFTEEETPIEFEKQSNEKVPWDQILIDSFGDKAVKDNSKVFDKAINQLQSFINKQSSYDEAINNLANLFDKLDLQNFEVSLTRLMFIADTIGRLTVQDEVNNART